jgi:hypothetical protein
MIFQGVGVERRYAWKRWITSRLAWERQHFQRIFIEVGFLSSLLQMWKVGISRETAKGRKDFERTAVEEWYL